MADVKVVRVKWESEDAQLEETKKMIALLKRELELSQTQVGLVTKKLNDLKTALHSATDPKEVQRLTKAITATEKELIRTEKAAHKLNSSIKHLDTKPIAKGGAALQAFGSQLGGMPAMFSNLKSVITPIGAAIAGAFAVKAIAGFVTEGVKLAATMEQNRIAFTTFLGSADKAEKVLEDIAKFGAETPFEFPELVDSAKRLIAMGESTETLMDTMRRLGDIASGTGKPLVELAGIYGKIRALGKAGMEEIRQLGEAGIPIFEELQKSTGKNQEELRKFIEAGKVGFPVIQDLIKNMTNEGGKFAGLTEAQSKSLNGLLSTLNDNWNEIKRSIGEALLPVLKDLSFAVIQFFNDAKLAFSGVKETFAPMVDSIKGIVSAWEGAKNAVDKYVGAIPVVGSTISTLKTVGTEILEFAGNPWRKATSYAWEYFKLVGEAKATEPAREGAKNLNIAMKTLQQNFQLSSEEGMKFLEVIKNYDPVGKSTTQIMKDLGMMYKDMVNPSNKTTEALVNQESAIAKLGSKTKEFATGSLAFLREELSKVQKLINETPADSGLLPGMVKQANILEKQIETIENSIKRMGLENVTLEEIPPMAVSMDLLNVNDIKTDIAAIEPPEIPVKLSLSEEEKQALISLTQTVASAIFDIWNANNQRISEAETEALNEQYNKEITAAGNNEAAKAKVEKKFAQQREALEKQQQERQKQAAITQAIINGALAVTSILAQAPKYDGGIAMLALIAAAVATTAAQVAVIESQSFAKGGIDIQGKGTETSDSIPANLSKGESVMTAKETKMWKPLFKKIRKGELIPGVDGMPILKHGEIMNGMISVNAMLNDKKIVSELRNQTRVLSQVLDNNSSRPNYQSRFTRTY